ncbi:MAG TPA: hypothetical protein VGP10_10640, partial [Marisediminicola sp.]|nr:hypothetical protein [Marisediminicola sp.]
MSVLTRTPQFHIARLRGRNNEGVLLGIIALLLLLIAMFSPGTLSPAMFADILRSSVVNMALALGVLLI